MADQNLTIGIKADSSQLRADLAVAQAQVRALGSELRAAANEAQQSGDTSQIRGLADAYENARVKVSGLKNELKETGAGGGAGSLGEALDGIVGSLEKMGGSFGAVGSLISTMTSGFTGLTTAVAATAAGFFELGKRAAESTIEAKNQAVAFGSSLEKFEGLKFGAGQMGVSGEVAATAFERFSRNLGMARERADAMAEKAAAAVSKVDNFAASFQALTDAVDGARLALDKSGTGMLRAGEGLVVATQNLNKLRQEYAGFRGTQEQDAALKERVRQAEIAQTLAQQRAKEAADAHALAVRKLAEEEEKRAAAQIKHNNELRDALTKQNAPAAGEEGATIGAGAKQATFTGSPGSDTDQALQQFADKIKAIVDPSKQAAEVMRAMGRGAAGMIPYIKLGGEAVRAFQEELKKLDVLPLPKEEEMALGFYKAFNRLETVVKNLSDAIGNIFGQMFTGGMDAMAKTLADNQAEIRAWAQTVVNIVGPALRGLAAYFTLLADGLHAIFGLIRSVATLFGQDWPTSTIAAVAATGGMVLAIGKLVGALGMVRAAFAAIAALASPWLAIAAVLAVIAAGMVAIIFGTQGISDAIRKYIGDDAANTFDHFVTFVRDSFDSLVKSLTEWIAGWATYFADKIGVALNVVQTLIDKWHELTGATADAGKNMGAAIDRANAAAAAPGGLGDVSTPSQNARGGLIRGPGTGTSDSIFARLSNREFVVNAAATARNLPLLHAINSGSTVPHFALGGMPRFAMGGMVTAGAGAGSGGGSVTVNLTLGGDNFAMVAPRHVADKLVRAARQESTTSAGKKPSWFD